MTEIIEQTRSMPEPIERFVLQWGDMGTQWGVNRSVAQIHALLYLSERPMNAEEIAETLDMARSNVSNSLKELQNWKIIRREPIPGDRRDHFVAETDVWTMAKRIASVRKEREIDPALETLNTCLADAENNPRISNVQIERLEAMHDFTSTMDRWYGQMLNVPTPMLSRLIRMGDRVVSLLGLSGKQKTPHE